MIHFAKFSLQNLYSNIDESKFMLTNSFEMNQEKLKFSIKKLLNSE